MHGHDKTRADGSLELIETFHERVHNDKNFSTERHMDDVRLRAKVCAAVDRSPVLEDLVRYWKEHEVSNAEMLEILMQLREDVRTLEAVIVEQVDGDRPCCLFKLVPTVPRYRRHFA